MIQVGREAALLHYAGHLIDLLCQFDSAFGGLPAGDVTLDPCFFGELHLQEYQEREDSL